ncbi:MAG: NAD(P)H-dependent oxidoreductase [Spirochaetia bacterium]
MRILLLQSSGRAAGNTARAVRIAEEALRAEAARAGVALETETVDLARCDLRPCSGCRSCFDRGESTCPCADELLSIKEKMKAADGLLLAGPVYVNDVNGVLKNWIDRLAHVCHRPEFAGKTAMLLATTGSTSARHTLRSMQVPLWTWGYRIARQLWVATGATMPEAELRERHGERIERAARRLFQDIRGGRAAQPSFLSLMVFRIQQTGWGKAAPGSIDYAYWKDRGWLDTRRCTWFSPHRANPLKVTAARLVGSVVAVVAT